MLDRYAKLLNDPYLAYIRTRSCAACGKSPVDPDHLKARSWREAKRNDYTAIAHCRKCHTEREQIGDEKFQIVHKVNLWQEAFWALLEFHLTENKERTDL